MTRAIVIGGGIAGCSTAFALAKRGIAVTLIERHEKQAQEASGSPLAMLYPKINIKPSPANILALQGFSFTFDLLKKLPNSGNYFNTCGQIQLAFNAREQAKQAALVNQSETQYLKFQLLNTDEASAIAGVPLKTGGLYLPQAGWVKPQSLCEALCSSPLISVVTSTEALSIEKQDEVWRVSVANQQRLNVDKCEAEIVVICNAKDIKQFHQCASAAITPVRGQLNWFKSTAESEKIKTIICSDHHVSPAVDGWHCVGTSYAPNDLRAETSPADTQQNLNALHKVAPDIYKHIDLESVQARVGWRSQTLDYMPLAGQLLDEEKLRKNPPRYNANSASLPWLSGLYVNAGHGSKGMITAPLSGELIAGLAADSHLVTSPQLASKLNPSRFLLRELGLKQLANSLFAA
jgi:tRNA 5-methylaminomethyl-2-thiouridine biosynthesis bifunctional protein